MVGPLQFAALRGKDVAMGFFDALFGKTDRKQQIEAAEHARFSRLKDLTQGFEILLAVGVKLLQGPSRPSVAEVAEFELLYRKQIEALAEHDAICRKHDELLSRSEGATRDLAVLKYEENVRPYAIFASRWTMCFDSSSIRTVSPWSSRLDSRE